MACMFGDNADSTTARQQRLKTVLLSDSEAYMLCAREATVHLSSNYLRGVEEGEEIFIGARWGCASGDVFLVKIYMKVRFCGNRFIPDSAIPSMSMYHCLDVAEYELRRLQWGTKRDGAVGWQFDVVDILHAWVSGADVQDLQVERRKLESCSYNNETIGPFIVTGSKFGKVTP